MTQIITTTTAAAAAAAAVVAAASVMQNASGDVVVCVALVAHADATQCPYTRTALALPPPTSRR